MSVFAGNQVHRGGFRADQLNVKFGINPARGFLVQQIQFSFTQSVSMIYEIGSEYVYYVGGRSQGTASLSRIMGPAQFSNEFLCLYNDVCCPQNIEFDGSGACPNNKFETASPHYTLEDAVLTTISISVAAQDVVINETLQMMFIDLSVNTNCAGFVKKDCDPVVPRQNGVPAVPPTALANEPTTSGGFGTDRFLP